MVRRYAQVGADGTVLNVVLWDGDTRTWTPPAEATMVPLDDTTPIEPGWRYAAGVFVRVAPETDTSAVTITADPAVLDAVQAQVAGARSLIEIKEAVASLISELRP